MAIITNTNLQNTRHDAMEFTGRWRESFGRPSPQGVWMLYGKSGSGKTAFALQLAKYLTGFGRVLYWSIEQGNSASFQRAWKREGMRECGSGIMIADDGEDIKGIEALMLKKRGPRILIIDSLTPLRAKKFGIAEFDGLRKRLKGKLLIWIGHERRGLPDTVVGDYILKLADLKMRALGFRVMTNARSGESLRDFTVWEKGSAEYWGTAI